MVDMSWLSQHIISRENVSPTTCNEPTVYTYQLYACGTGDSG
mgnify:CR=1 FL=1